MRPCSPLCAVLFSSPPPFLPRAFYGLFSSLLFSSALVCSVLLLRCLPSASIFPQSLCKAHRRLVLCCTRTMTRRTLLMVTVPWVTPWLLPALLWTTAAKRWVPRQLRKSCLQRSPPPQLFPFLFVCLSSVSLCFFCSLALGLTLSVRVSLSLPIPASIFVMESAPSLIALGNRAGRANGALIAASSHFCRYSCPTTLNDPRARHNCNAL